MGNVGSWTLNTSPPTPLSSRSPFIRGSPIKTARIFGEGADKHSAFIVSLLYGDLVKLLFLNQTLNDRVLQRGEGGAGRFKLLVCLQNLKSPVCEKKKSHARCLWWDVDGSEMGGMGGLRLAPYNVKKIWKLYLTSGIFIHQKHDKPQVIDFTTVIHKKGKICGYPRKKAKIAVTQGKWQKSR